MHWVLWCLGMQARRRWRQCRGLSWNRDVQVRERHWGWGVGGGGGGWQRGGGGWHAHGDRGEAHCWLTEFFICSAVDFIVSRMDAMVSVTSAAEGKHGSECVLRARARGCGGARRLMRAAHFRVELGELCWSPRRIYANAAAVLAYHGVASTMLPRFSPTLMN